MQGPDMVWKGSVCWPSVEQSARELGVGFDGEIQSAQRSGAVFYSKIWYVKDGCGVWGSGVVWVRCESVG